MPELPQPHRGYPETAGYAAPNVYPGRRTAGRNHVRHSIRTIGGEQILILNDSIKTYGSRPTSILSKVGGIEGFGRYDVVLYGHTTSCMDSIKVLTDWACMPQSTGTAARRYRYKNRHVTLYVCSTRTTDEIVTQDTLSSGQRTGWWYLK